MRRFGFAGLVLCAAAASAARANVGLLAYEGFSNGPLANLDGSAGGNGWTTPWMDTAQGLNTRITNGALAYSGLPTAPGAAQTQDWNSYDWTLYERAFPAASGDVLYISFLYRATPGYGGYGGLSVGNYPNEVWFGSPLGYYTYGLRYGRYGFSLSNVPEIVGVTTFLVLEVKLVPSTAQVHYALYVNPEPGMPKPTLADAEGILSGTALPTSLRIDNDGGVMTDEIRVATTWEFAAPGPCPGDLNGDNQADLVDLAILLGNYGMNGGATWADGDLSRDGKVDLADLAILLSYYGTQCA